LKIYDLRSRKLNADSSQQIKNNKINENTSNFINKSKEIKTFDKISPWGIEDLWWVSYFIPGLGQLFMGKIFEGVLVIIFGNIIILTGLILLIEFIVLLGLSISPSTRDPYLYIFIAGAVPASFVIFLAGFIYRENIKNSYKYYLEIKENKNVQNFKINYLNDKLTFSYKVLTF
jgi:hypothetical protein